MGKNGSKKKLCKWKKSDIEKDSKELKDIVRSPGYVCMKCGRAAEKKGNLCKPDEL